MMASPQLDQVANNNGFISPSRRPVTHKMGMMVDQNALVWLVGDDGVFGCLEFFPLL